MSRFIQPGRVSWSALAVMTLHGCTCGGGKSSPTEATSDYSDVLTPRVAIGAASSAAGAGSAASSARTAARRYYAADSAFYGSNFLCTAWTEMEQVAVAGSEAQDSSGLTILGHDQDALLAATSSEEFFNAGVIISNRYDATSCSQAISAGFDPPFCAVGQQYYAFDVHKAGEVTTWMVMLPTDEKLGDIEDITNYKDSLGDQYVLIANTGSSSNDPRDGSEAGRWFARYKVPADLDFPNTTATATAPAGNCSGRLTFPTVTNDGLIPELGYEDTSDFYEGNVDILAHAVHPGTGDWYFVDLRVQEGSIRYYEPVVYRLPAAQFATCDGRLEKVGTLPIAHWLILYIATLEDQDKKDALMADILEFVAPADENGDFSASPNAALRTRLMTFFGYSDVEIVDADTTTILSARTLAQLFQDGGAPGIVKSMFITGMDFSADGKRFVLSTYGGPIVAWEVGVDLTQGIPSATNFMLEYLHEPVVADEVFADLTFEVSGVSYYYKTAAAEGETRPEKLIFSIESNNDTQIEGIEVTDQPIFMTTCADE